MEYQFTPEQQAAIVSALQSVAVAQAEFWDVLRNIELEHDGLTIETDVYLTDGLASECNVPPRHSDLDTECVWDWFTEHAKVTLESEVQS